MNILYLFYKHKLHNSHFLSPDLSSVFLKTTLHWPLLQGCSLLTEDECLREFPEINIIQ